MYEPGQELSSLAFDQIIGGALDAVVKAQNNSSMTSVNFIKSVGFVNDENGNQVKPIYVEFKYPKEVRPYLPGVSASLYIKIDNGGKGYKKEAIEENYTIDKIGKVKVSFEVNSEGAIIAADVQPENEILLKEFEDYSLSLIAKDKAVLGEGAVLKVCLRGAKEMSPAVYQDMMLQVPILTMLPIPFIRIASTDIELNVKINSISQTSSSTESDSKFGSNSSAGFKKWGINASTSINASVSNQKKTSSSEEVKKEFSLNIKVHAIQDEMPAGLSRILDILEESIVPKLSQAPVAA